MIDQRGAVKRGQYEATSVPGIFVAGNVLRDVQLSIVAAAEVHALPLESIRPSRARTSSGV
jgi:thioredoxin reductase